MTVTIAAPVTINGTRCVVGVVVQKTGKYKYHAHRVLLADGSAFVLNKNGAELSTAGMLDQKIQQRPPNSSAPKNSIPQSTAKSNNPDEISSKRRALPDTAESVGKAKTQYTPKLGDKIFTTETRTYIETVDELYGIETHLRKVCILEAPKTLCLSIKIRRLA